MTQRIIVVGAGPVGLTAAATLARAGLDVVVVEKRSMLNRASKASTFHPPTLEILDVLGVLDRVMAKGVRVDRIQFRDFELGVVADFALSELAAVTRYPFRLHLEQAALTPFLLEKIRECAGAEVRFDCKVTGVSTDGNGVSVDVEGPGGPDRLAADYLIAADGAHSDVRQVLGIDFAGSDYNTKVLRVLTPQALEQLLPGVAPLTYVYRGEESLSLLKMPDCWRLILRVPAQLSDSEVLRPEWYGERIAFFFPDLVRTLIKGADADVFPVSKRIATINHMGRIVLAGDAVHVTNTRGGMNMNCGIHDAYALAQAVVAAALDGDDERLDDCAAARLHVARDELIPRTDKRVATGSAWLKEVRETVGSRERRLDFLVSSSMLDIQSGG